MRGGGDERGERMREGEGMRGGGDEGGGNERGGTGSAKW